MEKVVLKATKRNVVGKGVGALRRSGKLPAVIYGRHTDPINISLDAHSASLALGRLTTSSIVTLDVDGTEYAALVREKQRDYIKNRLLHVDFLVVSLTEKIRATVGLNFIGMSPAVKDYNAVLVKNLEEFQVECLPTDLPESIDVDISGLDLPGDSIRVGEVAVSDKIHVLENPDVVVAVATAARVEEVPAPGEEEEEVVAEEGEPEIAVERGKKEEEEEE